MRILKILMMLISFLRLKDLTSEEAATENLNSAEESFEDFIEDVQDLAEMRLLKNFVESTRSDS